MKQCNVCDIEKELHLFDKIKNPRTGNLHIRKTCRKCRNKRNQTLFYSREGNWEKHMKRNKEVFNRQEYRLYRRAIASLRSQVYRILSEYYGFRKKPLLEKDIYLKQHLQSLFTDNMSWSNYSKVWEIDHIISGVKLSREGKTIEEINHLSNIRPLLVDKNRTRERKKADEYLIYVQK